MAILKLSHLEGACSDQRALFRKHFGTGGEVTLAKVEAVATLFDWDWAAQHLLSPTARVEYTKVCAAALAEYTKMCGAVWAEHKKVCAAAWAEYIKTCDAAWVECDKTRAAAWFKGWEADHGSL